MKGLGYVREAKAAMHVSDSSTFSAILYNHSNSLYQYCYLVWNGIGDVFCYIKCDINVIVTKTFNLQHVLVGKVYIITTFVTFQYVKKTLF